jgi:hypothetical protein
MDPSWEENLLIRQCLAPAVGMVLHMAVAGMKQVSLAQQRIAGSPKPVPLCFSQCLSLLLCVHNDMHN